MILCLLEVIEFSSRIPLQLTRPGQLSSGCKRTSQSSFLYRIIPQEALIPLDYRFCSELERMACDRAHPNLERLKQSLVRVVERFPQEVLQVEAVTTQARRIEVKWPAPQRGLETGDGVRGRIAR
ncbi:unnamed protein product [Nezara viridula]|uniref:Uncharacterized protein n=1 Tax=Nezara viridula TaxID=85310 RepID=A0A9P0GVH4_NEZVI|nr:unnamed protein product [Nezara viridula]